MPASKAPEEKANFDPIINLDLAANPDMVYFGGIYEPGGRVPQAGAREGLHQAPFMGAGRHGPSTLAEIAGEALVQGKGTVYSSVSGPASVYPGTAKFISDFKAKFGAEPQPFARRTYDAMAICLKAIENAAKANGNKMPTRQQVAQAIRELKDFPGITGTYTFNNIGDITSAKYFVIKVVSADKNKWGENEVIQTLDIAPPSK